jgi:hypothetical protein
MKRILLLLMIPLAVSPLLACDMCGCFMGITPYDNQSGINMIYRYRSFNGYNSLGQQNHIFPGMAMIPAPSASSTNNFLSQPTSLQTASFKGPSPALPQVLHGAHSGGGNVHVLSSADYEVFNVYELRAKYFLHRRIEVNGILPVNNTKSLANGRAIDHTGLGDISMFAGYHLVRKIEEEKIQQRLITGGAIKLPVGNYYAEENDERIPLSLQPGTGGIDYFGYFNYILGYKKIGMSLNSMYKFNGENYYKERFANSATEYLNLFYKIPVKSWVLIPAIQAYYEYSAGLKIKDVLQEGTSMNIAMLGPGFDVYYKNISLNTSFQYTVFDRTDEGNLGSAGKIVFGLGYNIRQLNYLIKEKKDEEQNTQ